MTDVKKMFDAVDNNDFDMNFNMKTVQKTKIVDYHCLLPSSQNRTLIPKRVSQLVESIKLHGKLLEDIIVVENENGNYIVLSGHHRLAALKQLVEVEGLNEFSKVRIKIEEKNDLDNELTLIDCNLEREELNAYDKMMAIGRKEEILTEKKKKNEIQYEGSTRSYIASSNQLNDTQVGVYLRVYKKGSLVVKKALEENRINITQAYELAAIEQKEQKHLLQKILDPKKGVQRKEKQRDIYLEDIRTQLESYIQSKVILNKNTLSFKFNSTQQLNELLIKLKLDKILSS